MIFDEMLQELRTGVVMLLVLFIGGITVVFVMTHLSADIDAAPLILLGAALFLLVRDAIKYHWN